MTAQATGTFTVKSWQEDTWPELADGAKLTRASVVYGFEGDLTGEASWEAVMCYGNDGTAVFTGYQFVTGQLGGREGAVVMRADGEFAGGEAATRWEVVAGSGTGGLAGLRGAGSSTAGATPPGTYRFDYDQDPA